MADGKTLIADLPMMYLSDRLRFEREGGVWGRQHRARRKQFIFSGVTAVTSTVCGSAYVYGARRNTGFVLFSTFGGFAIFGYCVGVSLARMVYPNVASNSETCMMRRVWWAQQCSKNWKPSQSDGIHWLASHPGNAGN